MELYRDNKALQKNLKIDSSEIINLQINWDYKNNVYYTLIIYDIDTSSTFVHLLVTNIPRNDIENGTVVLDYMKPNPPSNSHRYIIAIFEQERVIIDTIPKIRSRFPLSNFIRKNNLYLLDEKMIVVESLTNKFYLDPPKNKSKNNIIKSDSDLDDRSEKYCSCVIKVAEKNTERCNLEKDWGNMTAGKMCYSPYAVCSKSVGTINKKCDLSYDYNDMTKEQLVSFLNLNNVKADRLLSKEQLLEMVRNKKL